MTLAATDSNPSATVTTRSVPVVVLGSDALLAVLPATPVQLAHACLTAGFTSVIPASWGDELIASATLRELGQRAPGPAIQCSCPLVAHRLLTVGGDLRPMMVSLVPPAVAVARYIRALAAPTRPRITYVGNCAGAVDESIDVKMSPQALLELLAERQLSVDDQPRVFESIIPADRRRFRSQPGGLPAAEMLWSEAGHRTLTELKGEDLSTELAQHLLSGANVLIDVAPRLGCLCSGAALDLPRDEARARVTALEPPRAPTPVVDETVPLDLRHAIPAASRGPIDVAARPVAAMLHPVRVDPETPPSGLPRLTIPRATGASEIRPRFSPPASRPPVTVAPAAREGARVLPRAYVARRRSSPRGLHAVRDDESVPMEPGPIASDRSPISVGPPPPQVSTPAATQIQADQSQVTARQVVLILIAAAAVISLLSATLGVLVGRAIVARPAAQTTVR